MHEKPWKEARWCNRLDAGRRSSSGSCGSSWRCWSPPCARPGRNGPVQEYGRAARCPGRPHRRRPGPHRRRPGPHRRRPGPHRRRPGPDRPAIGTVPACCLRFAATRSLASKDVTARYRRGPFRVVVKACRGCINGQVCSPRYSGKHLRRRVKGRVAGAYPAGTGSLLRKGLANVADYRLGGPGYRCGLSGAALSPGVRRQPHRAHLHQDRVLQPRRGGPVRDAARPAGELRAARR